MHTSIVGLKRFQRATFVKRNALVLAGLVACAGIAAEAQAAVIPLGTASTYAVLAASTDTNTGTTTISGDIGLYPGTSITGSGTIVQTNGTIHAADAIALQAKDDARTAYLVLKGLTGGTDISTQDLGAFTRTPGVYKYTSNAGLATSLTLSGAGQYVFQIGTDLLAASGSSINLTNGATADNVYFQVGSSATLDTTSKFVGTIIALTSDSLKTGATVDGRVIALNGAVTLQGNTITAVPEPSSMLVFAGMTSLLAFRKRASIAA